MTLDDDPLKQVWQRETAAVDGAAARLLIERGMSDRRRRLQLFWVSAAIIVPAWIMAFTLYPDLRLLASAGLAVSAWLMLQVYRRAKTPARAGVDVSCAAFHRGQLVRERDFYASQPKWFFLPVIVMQVAIVATLFMNERFARNPAFASSLSAFIVTVMAVLAIGYRRGRRIIAEIDQELGAIQGVEA